MRRLLQLLAAAPFLVQAYAGDLPSAATSLPEPPDPAEPLLREAALHSPLMLEQELRVAQADAFRFRGWRQYMPYITANYQGGYFNLIGAADPTSKEGEGKLGGSYSIAAYHPIYHWGAIEAEKNSTFAKENMARSDAVIAWRALVNDIRAKFLEAVVVKSRIALLESRAAASRIRQERTEQEFKLGRIVAAERTARLLEIRNQQLELDRAKIELAGIVARLRGLSGMEKFGVEEVPVDLPDVDWNDAAMESRLAEYEKAGVEDAPETKQARYAAQFYENQRVMAESRELPTFNLGASVTQTPVERPGGFGMQTYFFAGLMGTWNIFDRSTTQENVRSLRVAERLVDTKLSFGTLQRKTELRGALSKLGSSRQSRDLRRDIVKLRTELFEATRRRVDLGLAQQDELAASEDAMLAARLDLTKDRSEILSAYHAFMAGILLSPTDQLYTAPTNDR